MDGIIENKNYFFMEKKIVWIYWFKDDGIILFLKYSFF